MHMNCHPSITGGLSSQDLRVPSGGGSCGKGRATDLCHSDAQHLVLWTPHTLCSDSATFLWVPWTSIASLPSWGPHFSSSSESAQAQSPQFLCLSPWHWVLSPICLGCGEAKSVTFAENLCRQIIFPSATNLLQCKKTWGLSISVSGESKKDKHQGKHGNHYFPKLSWQGMRNRLKGGMQEFAYMVRFKGSLWKIPYFRIFLSVILPKICSMEMQTVFCVQENVLISNHYLPSPQSGPITEDERTSSSCGKVWKEVGHQDGTVWWQTCPKWVYPGVPDSAQRWAAQGFSLLVLRRKSIPSRSSRWDQGCWLVSEGLVAAHTSSRFVILPEQPKPRLGKLFMSVWVAFHELNSSLPILSS